MKKKMMIWALLLTVVAVGQIILAFILYDPEGNNVVINLGWGVLMISAIFGWLPIFTFRKRGKVQGNGYIHTTVLVDSGIYGVVRHPQYLAGILISLSLPMISQHWLVAVFGLFAMAIYYQNTFDEERTSIEKFGKAYEEYRQRVPRINFILGIIRLVKNRFKKT